MSNEFNICVCVCVCVVRACVRACMCGACVWCVHVVRVCVVRARGECVCVCGNYTLKMFRM